MLLRNFYFLYQFVPKIEKIFTDMLGSTHQLPVLTTKVMNVSRLPFAPVLAALAPIAVLILVQMKRQRRLFQNLAIGWIILNVLALVLGGFGLPVARAEIIYL